MEKFKGILLCTDLDGTLLNNDKTISEKNLSAIEYFKAEGGIFTFVTGRMPFFVSDIYQKVNPNAPFGCINGGGIFDHRRQEYLWTKVMPDSVLDFAEFIYKKAPEIGIQVNAFDKIYFCNDNSAMAEFREANRLPYITCALKNIKEPIAKIVLGDKNEENISILKEIINTHPMAKEFDFVRSEETLYEILPKNVSKGNILLKMAQILGVDEDKTIAVGDYNNDISMLKSAKVGVAVSNAVPDVKKIANYITVSNEESAIANIIENIDRGNLFV